MKHSSKALKEVNPMLNSIERAAIEDMLCEADHAVFEEDVADLVLDIFE